MTYRRKDEPRYVPEPRSPLCRSQWQHFNVAGIKHWHRWSWKQTKWIDYNHVDYPGQWVFTSDENTGWHEIPGVSSIEEAIKVAIALERLDALTPAVKVEPRPEVTSLT